MRQVLNIEQGSQEWHDERAKGIGSSEVAKIMGLSPWGNALDVYNDKVHGSTFKGNEATEYGKKTEPNARAFYEDLSDHFVRQVGMIVNDIREYTRVSPDGLIGNHALLEIKCPFSQKMPDEPDIQYYVQCQYQMLVAEVDVCCLLYYIEDGYRLFTIKADKEFQGKVLAELDAFWRKIQGRDPPSDELATFTVDDDETTKAYVELSKKEKEIKVEKNKLWKELKDRAGGRKMISELLYVTPSWSQGRADYKGACEKAGLDVPRGEPSLSYKPYIRGK